MPAELKRFLLVYSSQTGQAQAIAEEIAEKAPDHGLQADLHCISQTEKKFWLEREKLVVLITSTTGDGDPPDTANKFWRRLKKKTLERTHLSHLRFALLGLGDTNYSNFCNCAKSFNKRFEELGAVPFVEPGWGDDAVGLEVAVEPWMEELFPALRKELYCDPENGILPADTCDTVQLNGTTSTNGLEKNQEIDIATDGYSTKNIITSRTENSAGTENTEISNSVKERNQNDEVTSIGIGANEMNNSGQDTKSTIPGRMDKPGVSDKSTQQSGTDLQSGGDLINSRTKDPDHTDAQQGGDQASLPKQTLTPSTLEGPGGGGDPGAGSAGVKGQDTGVTSMEGAGEGAGGGQHEVETLAHSIPPLSENSLTLPVLPAAYLKITFDDTSDSKEDAHPELQNGCPLPSAKSDVVMATITEVCQLTRDDAVKKTLKLTLDLQEAPWAGDWCPGDSFGLLCPNPEDEVQSLLKRLGTSPDALYTLTVIPGTKKRAAAVPPHLPPSGTLGNAFTYCCDIRSLPKKALLRCMVEHASRPEEKRRLQELCSKQGAASYTRLLREPGVSLMDVLTAFPSCTPPVERLLEHLPRLLPRPYSAASCPDEGGRHVDFVFNVVNIPAGEGRVEQRHGVCTGHLDRITSNLQVQPGKDLSTRMEQLHINDIPRIPIYLRTNQHFRPCDDLSQHVVMIGPGTGVAPFVGFLQYRAQGLSKLPPGQEVGESWLFFGCRHEERDFIFRKELEQFESLGVLNKLLVSFSRDKSEGEKGDRPRYVQDLMRQQGESLVSLITDKKALVYVCGDAKGMARGVTETFTGLLQNYRGFTEKEAAEYLMDMRLSRRYREDVWT